MKAFGAVLWGLLLVSSATAGAAVVPSAPSWADGASVGHPFSDLSRLPAQTWPGDSIAVLRLDSPIRFRGALYDHLVLGPNPGTARLTSGETDPLAPRDGLLLAPIAVRLASGPDGQVQLRQQGQALSLRWIGLVDASMQQAAFEVLIEPGVGPQSDITYQYLQVPVSARVSSQGVRLEDTSRPDGVALPVSQGFDPGPGRVIVFPGDIPWHPPLTPLTGCDIATPWCSVVRAFDPGCMAGGHADATPCGTTVAKRWHFNEGQFCRSCPYTFYVTVECGTEMHLPFKDMEGNQIQITDVFTGVELELNAMNECARTPFEYCDYCNSNGSTPKPDPAGTVCPAGSGVPRIACEPYVQRSTLIQWGSPFQDLDGDTLRDDLPYGPANGDGCNGYGSGSSLAYEEQNVDVVLGGDPALCGVFRIDIVSGGYHWYLSANCNGIVPDDPAEIDRNFTVYQNCADALAAFDPVPELAITKLEFTGICPDIFLTVEVTNLGCADAPSSPVHLDFSRANQADLDVDLGVVAAGTSVETTIPVSLNSTPQALIASADLSNIISECTEQAAGSFSGCEPTSGSDVITTTLCACTNTVTAQAASQRVLTCGSNPAVLDLGPSSALPCATGRLEYRFLDPSGAIVQDWGPTSTLSFVPATCPSLQTYQSQVRCSSEIAPDCVDTVLVDVECRLGTNVQAAASASPICQGDEVTISAGGGYVSYDWDNGRSGRVLTERPAGDTTYRVTAVDAAGCVSSSSVTVQVLPDPVPGPLGNYLRARKEGRDVAFNLRELTTLVGSYELVCHEPTGPTPCATSRPTDPTPVRIDGAITLTSTPPGSPAWTLRHVDGIETCPKLLFYKVRATSPCTGTRGPTCDGFPMQLLPCP